MDKFLLRRRKDEESSEPSPSTASPSNKRAKVESNDGKAKLSDEQKAIIEQKRLAALTALNAKNADSGTHVTLDPSGHCIHSDSLATGLARHVSDSGWRGALQATFGKPYFRKIEAFLEAERAAKVRRYMLHSDPSCRVAPEACSQQTVFPPEDEIFAALNRTPLERVKVVIIGQDPYHDNGQEQPPPPPTLPYPTPPRPTPPHHTTPQNAYTGRQRRRQRRRTDRSRDRLIERSWIEQMSRAHAHAHTRSIHT